MAEQLENSSLPGILHKAGQDLPHGNVLPENAGDLIKKRNQFVAEASRICH